jgi:hypothetical protein
MHQRQAHLRSRTPCPTQQHIITRLGIVAAESGQGGISASGENPSNKARGEMSLASACLQRLQQSMGTLPDLQMLISEGRGNRRQQLVLVRRNLVVAMAQRV